MGTLNMLGLAKRVQVNSNSTHHDLFHISFSFFFFFFFFFLISSFLSVPLSFSVQLFILSTLLYSNLLFHSFLPSPSPIYFIYHLLPSVLQTISSTSLPLSLPLPIYRITIRLPLKVITLNSPILSSYHLTHIILILYSLFTVCSLFFILHSLSTLYPSITFK